MHKKSPSPEKFPVMGFNIFVQKDQVPK